MKKIMKESILRADSGKKGTLELSPLEIVLFDMLAEEVRRKPRLDNLYTIDVSEVERRVGESITQPWLMRTTGDMMRWIYEILFQDGGYKQVSLISSVRYMEEDGFLTIRVNPEMAKHQVAIGRMWQTQHTINDGDGRA